MVESTMFPNTTEVSQFVLREDKYRQCPKIEVAKQILWQLCAYIL